MKKLFKISLFVFSVLVLFAISGCTSSTLPTPTGESTQIPSATLPPTLTATPSPSPTPIPVTIQEAIQRGTFAELESFNKGRIYSFIYTPQSSYADEIIHLSTFSPDGQQFVAVTKRGIYAYDANSWEELTFIPLSLGTSITSTGFSVDSSLFAAGDSSGAITFWDMQSWEVQNHFQVHKGAVTSIDISPDNVNFVTIGDQKEISVWNMSDGSLIKSQLRSKRAGPAYYSLDGQWLYISEETTSRDLIVWSSNDLTLTDRLGFIGQKPPAQALSPYTNTIAAYLYGTVTFYDFDKKETSKVELDQRFTTPTFMTFLDEKTLLMKFLRSHDYYLVDLKSLNFSTLPLEALSKKTFKNPEFLHILKRDDSKALGFKELGYIQDISPDGNALLLVGNAYTPSGLFDLNQKVINNYPIGEFPWENSMFLSDGSLAGVDWRRTSRKSISDKMPPGEFTITILSPESQFAVKSKIKQKYDLSDFIDKVSLSPSGKFLAAGTVDGNLYIWNLNTEELIATFRAHNKFFQAFSFYYAYRAISFDESGSYLATWGLDGNIKVFNVEDLSEVASVYGEGPVFSPDGNYLAYISTDGSIRLMSLTGDNPKVFNESINKVNSIAFSADGTLLFSGDYNDDWNNPDRQSKLKVWSISDATLLLDVPQHNVVSFFVHPDGTHLYVHDGDGVISVWGHDPEKE